MRLDHQLAPDLFGGQGGLTPRGYIDGLETANGVDADHDIVFSPGIGRSDDDLATIANPVATTKQIDAVFAEGTDAGGLDVGVVAADEEYNLFAIAKDEGTVDFLFSLSPTAPTLPTGFTKKRRIWAAFTDASANIHPYEQDGDLCRFDDPIEDVSDTTGTLSVFALASLTVPSKGLVKAHVYVVGNATVSTDPGNVGINLRTNGRAEAGVNELFFGARLAASSGATVGVRGQGTVIADDGLIEYTLTGNLSTWVLARIRTYAYEDRRGRDR